MKKVKWQMKENFVFPSALGSPTTIEQVKVTPRFTIEKVEERPKLTGIYHLAVNMNLETEKNREPNADEAILIDDLDIEGTTGYFEYAVPFNIDFPPEASDPVDIKTSKATSEVDESGRLSVIWDVECSYKEVPLTAKQIEEQVEKQALASETASREQAESASNSHAQEEKQEASFDSQATAEATETAQLNESSTESAEAKKAAAAEVVVESTSFSEGDEVLSFISELDDGISTTGFRLNDVLVQEKS